MIRVLYWRLTFTYAEAESHTHTHIHIHIHIHTHSLSLLILFFDLGQNSTTSATISMMMTSVESLPNEREVKFNYSLQMSEPIIQIGIA